MSKSPINNLVDVAKKNGPGAIKFVKENKEAIKIVAPAFAYGAKKLNDYRIDKKKNSGLKEHPRKKRYSEYQNEILKNLDKLKRWQLASNKKEVESFIEQIKNEEEKELGVKKPIHSKRINEWKNILIQIENRITLMDYQEYHKLFNDPKYTSLYFEGNERSVSNFLKLVDEEDLESIHAFIFEQTRKSKEIIKKDFI